MKILGIILARKNSKRLKDKNTKLLNRKPLIKYTINAAIESKVIDEKSGSLAYYIPQHIGKGNQWLSNKYIIEYIE